MAKIGFIGCGNMGGALARAAAKCPDNEVLVFDPMTEKAEALQAEFGAKVVSAEVIASTAKYVVMGVKPQNIRDVMGALQEAFRQNDKLVIVSMAAAVSIDAVQEYACGDYPVVRIMPNTPCMLGAGAVLYAVKGVSSQDEADFLAAMKGAGEFFPLAEDLIDAAGALSGCGPAYFYLYANGLAQGAEKLGVDRETAVRLAAQTLLGAGKMLLEYGDPIDLKNKVCSPGGTTLAGVAALEKGSLEAVAASAVDAAYVRTLELKK